MSQQSRVQSVPLRSFIPVRFSRKSACIVGHLEATSRFPPKHILRQGLMELVYSGLGSPGAGVRDRKANRGEK